MKPSVEQKHSVAFKKGKSRCTKCSLVEPDLQQPCPKAKTQPAGTKRK